MRQNKIKIFCDFDGTITKNDVWVDALGKFITKRDEFDKLCADFANGKITSKQCIKNELDLIENFDFESFDSYIENQELDDYFLEFNEYCRKKHYKIFLLSEGLDYYINHILNKFRLKIPFFCNTMIIKRLASENREKIKLTCEFPYSDENCNWCGMSKRNILIENTDEYSGEISVFIGDGVSDFCVCNYADIVFAKKSLASYCWKNNITYHEYNNFGDIIKKLENMEKKNLLKVKQNAKILRKDLLLGG